MLRRTARQCFRWRACTAATQTATTATASRSATTSTFRRSILPPAVAFCGTAAWCRRLARLLWFCTRVPAPVISVRTAPRRIHRHRRRLIRRRRRRLKHRRRRRQKQMFRRLLHRRLLHHLHHLHHHLHRHRARRAPTVVSPSTAMAHASAFRPAGSVTVSQIAWIRATTSTRHATPATVATATAPARASSARSLR